MADYIYDHDDIHDIMWNEKSRRDHPNEEDDEELKWWKVVFSKVYLPFIIQMLLLVCIIALAAVCFGYNVNSLKSINGRKYNFETMKIISSLAVSISKQSIYFGTPAAGSSPEITNLANALSGRKDITLDFNIFNQYLANMFESAVSTDPVRQSEALEWIESLGLLLTHEAQLQTSKQMESASTVQIGLQCVSAQLLQLYFHNALLETVVFDDWDSSTYRMFDGLRYDELSYPDCDDYLPQSSQFNFANAINNGPTLQPNPGLVQTYTVSPLNQLTVFTTLQTLEGQINEVESVIAKFWEDKQKNATIITIFSCICMVVAVCFVLLSPFFFTRDSEGEYRSSVTRYKQLESKLKLLGVYASSIVALKEDPHLYRLLDGTFLVKLIGFIRRARPFVPQTGFGDIESIVLSSTENGMYGGNFIGGNVVGGNAAGEIGVNDGMEDDQRAQELRTEVGLQVAYGTMMCLSSRGLVHFSEDDDELSSECVSLNGALSVIERIANGRHGAIHSVTHRFLYISWNVNSSCPDHELEALYTALEIHEALRELCVDLSISIATSLVVAGTVEESEQRAVMVCGPAMLCCEKLQALNRYHKTTIAMDKQVAGKVFSLNVPGADYCAVPISLYRVSPAKSQYDVAYGLFPSRLTEPLKAWATMLKDFPSQMEAKRIREMLMAVEEYKATFPSNAGGGGADAVSIEPTIRFWMMTLEALRYAEYQGK